MAENITIQITSESGFDGITPINLTRDDFEVVDGRTYKATIQSGGRIPPDFFQLFSAAAPKLVGLSINSWNPLAVARVVGEDSLGPNSFRQEVDITPHLQHVAMFGGDSLGVVAEGARNTIYLTVNEMSEEDHVHYALRTPQRHQWRRFRIVRDVGTGFQPNFNDVWEPNFSFAQNSNLLVTTDNGEGAIPIANLCLYPRFVGCFYTVRFANVFAGRIYTWQPATKDHRQLDLVPGMEWSEVQFASHDDHVVLVSSPPQNGNVVLADIEVVRARPIDRMRGRFTREA